MSPPSFQSSSDDEHRDTTAEWAQKEYELWQEAIRERKAAEDEYNRWLTEADRACTFTHIAEKDILNRLQHVLNEIYSFHNIYNEKAGRRFSLTWIRAKLGAWLTKPVLEKMDEFHGALVHLINELLDHIRTREEQERYFRSVLIRYFQQITPMVDTKFREVWREENHNITYQIGRIWDAVHRAWETHQWSIERALQDMWYALHKLESEYRRIRQYEQKFFPDVHPLQDRLRDMFTELAECRTRIEEMMNDQSEKVSSPNKDHVLFPRTNALRYLHFENIFRTRPEELTEQQREYINFFREAPGPVIDIGCGRGEFFFFFWDEGIKAVGVDINAEEIESLKKQGFTVFHEDILSFLKRQDGETYGGAFAAQVVEHMPPDEVYAMLEQLYRVLKKDGVVIIETLNPESILGHHTVFFLDPTHIFPVHPRTLTFFLRHIGYSRVHVEYRSHYPDDVLPCLEGKQIDRDVRDAWDRLTHFLRETILKPIEYYIVAHK